MNINNRKGSALVEMALSLTLLMLLVFGIFEFGRAMYLVNTLNNAARYGARLAVVNPISADNLVAQVKSHAVLSDADRSALQVAMAITDEGATEHSVRVTTRLPFAPVVPLMADFFGPGFTLSGEASMRLEYTIP